MCPGRCDLSSNDRRRLHPTAQKSRLHDVEGYVASAGTLIAIVGTKRFMQPNAYMHIHELTCGVWDKMSYITDTFNNQS
jgi:ATP-dependent protease ClpP protease subunit